MDAIILIRGGGDLASGLALRLRRTGFCPVIIELPQPLCVRRTVSFAEAVYAGQITIEGITGRLIHSPLEIPACLAQGEIPVLVDPAASLLNEPGLPLLVLVDARLAKMPPPVGYLQAAPLVIGVGPGFTAGVDCHAVIETQRGHRMGRVYWQGPASTDSGQPDGDPRRVLRAPCTGALTGYVEIGKHVEAGERIASISTGGRPGGALPEPVQAPFRGVLRGLIHPGLRVVAGMKIGDVDPRDDPSACWLVSDKALAVGGGVLEAILSRADIARR